MGHHYLYIIHILFTMISDLKTRLSRRIESGVISQTEGDLAWGFLTEYWSLHGGGDETMAKKLYQVISVAYALHQGGATLDSAGTFDYLAAASVIRERGDFAQAYKLRLIITLRHFAIWCAELNSEINIEKIRKIALPKVPQKKKCPDEMLTRDEVLQIIEACGNSRDRALIATLYDGSNRPVELLSLNWSDLHFDEHGAWFETNRKTGIRRRIRLTLAVPYLAQWQVDYPEGVQPDVPVFCQLRCDLVTGRHERLTKSGLDGMIVRLKRRTGIAKLHPYSFRPSRITHDVEDGYDPQYIMMKNWGTLKTTMLERYTNLNDSYIDTYALERAGMISPKAKEAETKKLLPAECPHCFTINPPSSMFCSRCGLSLTEVATAEEQDIDGLNAQKAQDMIDYLRRLIDSGDLPQSE